ncbi:MAG: MBL fold metallo-hydrolase [Actinomycetota bacterium]|jgi:glyoxylase-like metal-dependent hydrolase (beta-lactamase superfamily II)
MRNDDISMGDFLSLLDRPDELFLCDVREPEEYAQWRIPGARNFPLGDLAASCLNFPSGVQVVLICAKGARAEQGAEILRSAGLSAAVLAGGMGAWGVAYDQVEMTLGGALVIQVRRRGKGCLSYVVGAAHGAIVIDPSAEFERYVAIAQQYGLTISHVFDTHLHADHLSGARELAEATGATLVLNASDPFNFAFTPMVDGLSIQLGDDVHFSVSAVSAPGHTEGSTVFQLGEVALFTGDTLFLESVGRPDLADQAEAFAHSLYQSLHNRVLPLNDDFLIFPAHFGDSVSIRSGEATTRRLGDLRTSLPALALTEEDFVTWAVANISDRPGNYQEIVRFNAGRSSMDAVELRELELGPNRCAVAL